MMNHVEIWDKARLEAEEDEKDGSLLEMVMDGLDISI